MNLPNKITTARLLLAAVLFVLLDLLGREPLPGWKLTAVCFFLFIVVTATDALDGYYARKLDLISDFGRIADPAADKVIICGSFVFLSAVAWGRDIVPPWIVVTIIAREFIVTALRGFMETKGHAFGAEMSGKLKMIVQCIAIPAVLMTHMSAELFLERWPAVDTFFWWLAVGMVWATLVITVWSGIHYIAKSWKHLKESGI